jgi:hypothetical protein
MKIESIALAAVALCATSTAFAAGAPAPKPEQPPPARVEQTLVDELTSGMRDILRAVTPEIALPKIEIKLPALAPRRG